MSRIWNNGKSYGEEYARPDGKFDHDRGRGGDEDYSLTGKEWREEMVRIITRYKQLLLRDHHDGAAFDICASEASERDIRLAVVWFALWNISPKARMLKDQYGR